MADDATIRVKMVVESDPQSAAQAGKESAKAYQSGLATVPPNLGKQDPFSIEKAEEGLKKWKLSLAIIKRETAESLATSLDKTFRSDVFGKAAQKIRDLVDVSDVSEISKEHALKTAAIYEQAGLRSEDSVEKQKEKNLQKQEKERIKTEEKIKKTQERADKEKESRNLKFMKLTESMAKNYSMLSGVVLNPFGGLTTMFSARQVFQARRDQAAQQRLMGQKGESIVGSIGMTIALVGIATAIGAAAKSITVAAEIIKNSMARGKEMFAKATVSGFGMFGAVSRSNIASVLGVDEKEIYRFGNAMTYVASNLKNANNVIAQTSPITTKMSYDWDILKIRLASLADSIVVKFAPAIEQFAEKIGIVIDKLATAFLEGARVQHAAEDFAKKKGLSVNWVGQGAGKPLAPEFSGKGVGKSSQQSLQKEFQEFLKTYSLKSSSFGMGQPAAFMKQLPASAFERMGLVIGSGVGVNYSQKIAHNTAEMVKELKKLVYPQGQMKIQPTPALA